ncbi:aarF domain-containing protein kinase 1 [Seminavis robusta]|uniref:AarF domain-containing protein kinase 1 n=1 Tax=Seminavis robusta TaxID=568900 RepID=A0A9N8HDT4_9STRA|nr:aarF domain-containing protein kinase 1 [Seminavis robusta]|eukprot:Sro271_g104660.1 aarF domain-containing protein kinase 1 (687) ;mRNA; f:64503-66563
MLRVGLQRVARGTAQVVSGSALVATTGVAAYVSTEQGRGMRRELLFWKGVAPVVFDYYWNFASSSPYVKYQKYLEQQGDKEVNEQESKKLQELHERHAPEILNVLLELKGLYVKLGQVLSVTTLPIPESYRSKFRTLQSDVPGWEAFEESVKPVLERELNRPIEEIFESIDPVPCGAASIGQAHKAVLRANDNDNNVDDDEDRQVIIKIQYPDASWQIPADIQCVGDFLKICVFFGVVDESAANLSFNEFSRQFIAELDYDQERRNLQDIYQSSLDPKAPYQRRGVVVPQVYPELCTSKIITMTYLPGPKLEEEARRQLQALGIDTKKGLRSLVRTSADTNSQKANEQAFANGNQSARDVNDDTLENDPETESTQSQNDADSSTLASQGSWQRTAAQIGSKLVSVNSLLGTVRMARRVQLWCTVLSVKSIDILSETPLLGSMVPSSLHTWAEDHSTASKQSERMALTKEWIDALFDVHGHQIFNLGCFNADAHPGNILVVEDENSSKPKLGLIDFGQCRRLTRREQAQVARLLVSVANNEPDEVIAAAFRDMGIQTKNDSTEFLSKFAKLMFGPLQSYHLDHAWHKELHKQDGVTYFPNQLSLVYRTSMLLRGLAVSLQFNVSVGDLWKEQALEALDRYDSTLTVEEAYEMAPVASHPARKGVLVIRRETAKELVQDMQESTVASR